MQPFPLELWVGNYLGIPGRGELLTTSVHQWSLAPRGPHLREQLRGELFILVHTFRGPRAPGSFASRHVLLLEISVPENSCWNNTANHMADGRQKRSEGRNKMRPSRQWLISRLHIRLAHYLSMGWLIDEIRAFMIQPLLNIANSLATKSSRMSPWGGSRCKP